MKELSPWRLTTRLLRSWKKTLEPRLLNLLPGGLTPELAKEIKTAVEAAGLPRDWKFGRRYFNKKRGWIFVLKGIDLKQHQASQNEGH